MGAKWLWLGAILDALELLCAGAAFMVYVNHKVPIDNDQITKMAEQVVSRFLAIAEILEQLYRSINAQLYNLHVNEFIFTHSHIFVYFWITDIFFFLKYQSNFGNHSLDASLF